MTFTEAAVEVLRLVGRPLHYKKITEIAIAKNLLSHVGKAPDMTMSSRLATMIKKDRGEEPIVKVKPGVFALREFDKKTIALADSDFDVDIESLPDPEPKADGEEDRPVDRRKLPGADVFPEEEDDDEPILSKVDEPKKSQGGGGGSDGGDDEDGEGRGRGRRRRRKRRGKSDERRDRNERGDRGERSDRSDRSDRSARHERRVKELLAEHKHEKDQISKQREDLHLQAEEAQARVKMLQSHLEREMQLSAQVKAEMDDAARKISLEKEEDDGGSDNDTHLVKTLKTALKKRVAGSVEKVRGGLEEEFRWG